MGALLCAVTNIMIFVAGSMSLKMKEACTTAVQVKIKSKVEFAYAKRGNKQLRVYNSNNDNGDSNSCQPGLGAFGASLSSPGRPILSDLIGAEMDR